MARALATRPRLLLLDEVTGGVDQRSIPGLVALIGRLQAEGVTLLVIEHNMQVIMSVATRIVALHLGEKIADGPPAGRRRATAGSSRRTSARLTSSSCCGSRGSRSPTGTSRCSGTSRSRSARGRSSPSSARTAPASPLSSTACRASSRRAPAGSRSTAGASTGSRPTRGWPCGLAHVLERRRLFPHLTVRQNLLLGAYHPAREAASRGEPRLGGGALPPPARAPGSAGPHALRGRAADGGHRARPHGRPRLLLVDEPTLGLAPRVVADILEVLRRINREQGVTVVFIEQNVELALSIAHRGYVLESGRLLLDGAAEALRTSDEVRRIFLGR